MTTQHIRFNSSQVMTTTRTLPSKISIFGEDGFLGISDIRQYLYVLYPKTHLMHDSLARSSSSLGKLDIAWRTTLGQMGRLQTSQLNRKVPSIDPVDIFVLDIPDTIQTEIPFKVQCRIKNNLVSEPVKVVLGGVKSKMSTVLPWGQGDIILEEIEPMGLKDVSLDFYPLLPGLHKISGIKITETISGISREIDLADVFVLDGSDSPHEER